MPAAGVGKPRRHFAGLEVSSNGSCPVFGLRVGHERKGRDLPRTMATLAMLFENRKYVLVERCGGLFARQGIIAAQKGHQPQNRTKTFHDWIVSRIAGLVLTGVRAYDWLFVSS